MNDPSNKETEALKVKIIDRLTGKVGIPLTEKTISQLVSAVKSSRFLYPGPELEIELKKILSGERREGFSIANSIFFEAEHDETTTNEEFAGVSHVRPIESIHTVDGRNEIQYYFEIERKTIATTPAILESLQPQIRERTETILEIMVDSIMSSEDPSPWISDLK